MLSSDDMYTLGVQDAEQETPNFFYYQHYYHYRLGYDRTRRRISRSGQVLYRFLPMLSVVALVILLVGGGVLVFQHMQGTTEANHADRDAPQYITATPTATATPTPRPPTPTPEPSLHVGGLAEVVNVGDVPLRGRSKPGVDAPVRVRFPEGSHLTIVDGPTEQDGYTWWQVEAQQGKGWCAEREPEGTVWLVPVGGALPGQDRSKNPSPQ
jgi:hypothetical protein